MVLDLRINGFEVIMERNDFKECLLLIINARIPVFASLYAM